MNIKVLCKHQDGWAWSVVVRELIDAMILDKTQFHRECGQTYTIMHETEDEPTYGSLFTSIIVDKRFKLAIGGNYAD